MAEELTEWIDNEKFKKGISNWEKKKHKKHKLQFCKFFLYISFKNSL